MFYLNKIKKVYSKGNKEYCYKKYTYIYIFERVLCHLAMIIGWSWNECKWHPINIDTEECTIKGGTTVSIHNNSLSIHSPVYQRDCVQL